MVVGKPLAHSHHTSRHSRLPESSRIIQRAAIRSAPATQQQHQHHENEPLECQAINRRRGGAALPVRRLLGRPQDVRVGGAGAPHQAGSGVGFRGRL